MQGVFLDKYPLDLGDVELAALESLLPGMALHEETAEEQVVKRIGDAEVVILNKVVLDRDILRRARRLKLVVLSATGTDNVDLEAARELGIAVCNCRGYATAAVVQHSFALLLALCTRLIDYDYAVREHSWEHSRQFCLLNYPIQELAGRTLGIVGYGELGQGVARVAEAFGMRVLVAERPGAAQVRPDRVALPELLQRVDALSLHCPLTPETRHLIDREALMRMPRHAFLINTARGGVVDEQALADALKAGEIAGAGIDVLSQEPPRDGNPLLDHDVPNLIVTPHSAWGSREARQRALDQIVESIRGFLEGEPVRVVNS